MSEARILLVDDEQSIIDLLKIVLTKEGFRHIYTALDGQTAINIGKRFHPHLIILDVMLPDMEGFDVCREFRKFTDVPILFLTAKNTDLDKLVGFSMGADDYITKPFNPLEVAARVKAQLRRIHRIHLPEQKERKVYDYGHFRLDLDSGQLMVDGQEVPCPAMEFKLLAYLCAHPNQIFSKQQLYEQVWGEESLGDDNTVMVHIRRIREKIEPNPSRPQYLVTVRGLGYKMVVDRGKIK
ncbi:response regulator transcription factor [Thermoflavimicrobium dichotomicum]|uniref:DNA-binding response regulator, OmpR family, contains REC and winged-helix (WHTH) domain n=1 Tax=Thermoflavimicrobium dichotomicum TaxID=46223 RepID=A0A1I3JJ93_9BACL|nr:response regulator transcription factor [Thermoflavimicrobium dichotomicum]SFI60342.1 DNA-binding response regulator, OmpR family, contains REC and winged-helix (wHTH) domain [Thermoflavimicrobium dichotomicum]